MAYILLILLDILYLFDFIVFLLTVLPILLIKQLRPVKGALISGFHNPLVDDPALDNAPGAQVLDLHAISFYAILLCLTFHGGGEVTAACADQYDIALFYQDQCLQLLLGQDLSNPDAT